MNNSDCIASLLSHYKNKTLVRNVWHGKNKMNQETACWLGAFGKDISSPSQCPAELMPVWLAWMIPNFDDNVSDDKWQEFTDQYIKLAQQWYALTPEAWSRVHTETMLCILNIAFSYDEKAVAPVIELYERRKVGNEPSLDEWKKERADTDVYFADVVANYAAIADADAKSQTWNKFCQTTFDAIQKEIELAS